MRIPPPLPVDARDEDVLSGWISSGEHGPAVARRARIVLLSREGFGPSAIAAELGCSKQTVITWRERYRGEGLIGLRDAPRSGRPATVDVAAVLRRTLEPAEPGRGRWSTRRLAAEFGISNVAVAKVWRSWGIVPTSGGRVNLATDPAVDAPVAAVVGLYVDPLVRVLAVLVETGGQGLPGGAEVPVAQRPDVGARFADLASGARPGDMREALTAFLRLLDPPTRAARDAAAGRAGTAPLRLSLLVDGIDGGDEAVRHRMPARSTAVLHRVPAGLDWERAVRVACLVAGASTAGSASVARLHRAVAGHRPSAAPFSWVDSVAIDMQEARSTASGSGTSFTEQHHSNGSA